MSIPDVFASNSAGVIDGLKKLGDFEFEKEKNKWTRYVHTYSFPPPHSCLCYLLDLSLWLSLSLSLFRPLSLYLGLSIHTYRHTRYPYIKQIYSLSVRILCTFSYKDKQDVLQSKQEQEVKSLGVLMKNSFQEFELGVCVCVYMYVCMCVCARA